MPSLPNKSVVCDIRENELFIENVSLRSLAKTYGTPLYVYSKKRILEAIADWKANLRPNDTVFYAVKANSNLSILREFVNAGLGFDIVSGGELQRAIKAGVNPAKILYSGVGKTVGEITLALKTGVGCINVESESELYRLSNIASELNLAANIALRVNPDVDAKTHPYISTGLKENKFGVAYKEAKRLYRIAATLPGIRPVGVSSHIGSQITECAPFVDALEKILVLVKDLKAEGISLTHIDVGGGLGVTYTDETPPSAASLIVSLQDVLTKYGESTLGLSFEPGRHLIAPAGVLLTEVQYLKPTEAKNFCIVDAAMNDMVRPSLYEATMPLFNCLQREDSTSTWDIVGPVCESGDWLYRNASLAVKPGDILAMPTAGAYGASMASNYNSRMKPAEILVDGDTVTVIRRRDTFDDLIRNEL